MNLRQLKYFTKVVEAGNMTRAAEQLNVAQPALGMQIRQLEEDLGVALIVRHSRGVEATKAGALLHTQALAILKLVDDTRSLVASSEEDAPEMMRFGLTPSLMQIVGSEIAIQVREGVPQVSLSLVEHMSHLLHEALAEDKIDAALAYDVPDAPDVTRVAVYQEDLVLVTLPGAEAGTPITLADALDERLALPEIGDSIRNHMTRAAREIGVELNIAYEVRSIAAIKDLVARGAAAGILPYGTVLDETRSGKLDARPIIGPSIRRTLFLAFSRKRGPFRCELALTGVIRKSLVRLAEAIGPLGHPLPPRDS